METVAVHILTEIPFEPDLSWLFKRLRVKPGSPSERDLRALINEAGPLARPKGLYFPAYVTDRSADWIDLQGVHFESRVLSVNLEGTHRVFPYLATCGTELQAWAAGIDDMLWNFWAEAVKEAALFCALRALFEDLESRYRPGKMASMSPGSLADWPIQQQQPLFALFDGANREIGVELTDSLLMVPTKTVSGIRFSTEIDFESCQLCSREGCPGRRSVYDPELYDSRYCKQNQFGLDAQSGEVV